MRTHDRIRKAPRSRKPHNGMLTLQALTADYSKVSPTLEEEEVVFLAQALTTDYPGKLPQPEKPVKCKSKRKKPLERDIKKPIIYALNRHPKVDWAAKMNVGAFKIGQTQNGKGRYFRAGFKGLSDVIGQLKTGEFLAVEVKRPGEKPTPEQVAFLARVNKNGGIGILAHSVDDVLTRLGAV